MADSSLSVKVTADISDLRAQLALGQQVQRDYNTQVRDLAKQAAAAGEAQRSVLMPALQAAAERAAAAKTEVASLNAELKSMNGGGGSGFTAMKTQIEGLQAPLTAAMGLGEAFMATFAIDKITSLATGFANFGAQIARAMDATGMSAGQLSALKLAGEENEMEFTQLSRVMTIFARNISTAREGSEKQALAFNALGITTKDLADHGNDLGFMLETVAKRLNEWGDGGNKAALETAIFGGRVQGLAPILKDVAENGMAGLEKHAKDLGLDMNDPLAKNAEHAEQVFKDFSAASEGLGHVLGEMLLPALTQVAQGFTQLFAGSPGKAEFLNKELETTEKEVAAIQARIGGEGLFAKGLDLQQLTADQARIADIKAQLADIRNQSDKAVTIPEPAPTASGGKPQAPTLPDLTGEVGTMRTQMGEIAASWDGTMSGMIAKQQQTVEATRQLLATQLGGEKAALDLGNAQYSAVLQERDRLQVQANKAGQTEAVAGTREQVSEINAQANIGMVQRIEQDRAAWQALIDQHKVSGAQLVDVQRQVNQLTAQLQKEQATEAASIARNDADTDIAISRLKIEAQKSSLDEDLELHRINAAQKLQILKDLTNQEFQLTLGELQKELGGLANQPIEYEKVYNQIRELKAKNVEDLAALDRGAVADAARAASQQVSAWKAAAGEITSAESSLVNNILNSQQKLSQTLLQVAGQFVEREIANDLKYYTMRALLGNTDQATQMAREQAGLLVHLTTEQAKTTATEAGNAARAASDASSHESFIEQIFEMLGQWLGFQTSKTTATVTGNSASASSDAAAALVAKSGAQAYASEAATAAMASVAAIPLVGWAMAPEVGASVFAEATGFASAAGGIYDIPSDNFMVNAHAGEAMMPANIAGPMRDFFSNGGGSAGGGGGGIVINQNISVNAVDGPSVVAHANKFAPIYAKAVTMQLQRNPSLRGKY